MNPKKKSPYNEEDSTNPINEYGKSKLNGEINLKKSLLKSHAGAGFNILIKPFFFAAFKKCNVTSFGISNCVKNIFDFLIIFVSISSLVKLAGAPLTTIIAFFPVFLST